MFHKALRTELDLLMPVKKVRVNTFDVPWMTQHLKSLKRQKAFHEHGLKSPQFKFYHNAVNRERKSSTAFFFETKVQSMTEEDPKAWLKEVKRLSDARAHSGALCNHIHAEGAEELSPQDLTNAINEAFLEPMEAYFLTSTNPPERGLSAPPGGVIVAHYETLSKSKSV